MKKEIRQRKVLFVCTGNIFRSLIAKYCLEDYIKKRNIKNIIVDSVGTIAGKEDINPIVLNELNSLGIDPSNHKQKKLTKRDLEESDIVIVMTQNHIDFIKDNFGFDKAVLFNEVVNGKKTSLLDVNESIPNWHLHKKRADQYLKKVVRYISKSMPKLYKNLDRYL
jgi:protein-tyrosine phosphatase